MRDKEGESERKWSSNLSLCLTSALQWASVIFNMPSTDGSDCKKSAGNVKDLDLIPRSGRSSAGGHGTPVFLPGEFSWTEEPGRLQSMG